MKSDEKSTVNSPAFFVLGPAKLYVKPKKSKKKSRKNYRKECLDLWSLCVRTQQRKCQFIGCNKDTKLTAHHIRSITNGATMLDLSNGLCICVGHHLMQKLRPEWFQDKVIEVIGNAEYERLKKKSSQLFKWTQSDLKMMVFTLKNKLKSLQAEYGELK